MISQITKHRDFLLTTLYNAQDGQPNVGTNLTKYNSMQIFKAENKKIPDDINYDNVSNLRKEARQKLTLIKPSSIGQA